MDKRASLKSKLTDWLSEKKTNEPLVCASIFVSAVLCFAGDRKTLSFASWI